MTAQKMGEFIRGGSKGGRRYLLCVTKPKAEGYIDGYKLTESPHDPGKFWVSLKGYAIADARRILAGVVDDTGATSGMLFTNGEPGRLVGEYSGYGANLQNT